MYFSIFISKCFLYSLMYRKKKYEQIDKKVVSILNYLFNVKKKIGCIGLTRTIKNLMQVIGVANYFNPILFGSNLNLSTYQLNYQGFCNSTNWHFLVFPINTFRIQSKGILFFPIFLEGERGCEGIHKQNNLFYFI